MANSDTRFLYTDDDGNLVIVIPADNTNLTLEQIKAKSCPSGKTVYTVDKSAIPIDRSFRNAWTYTE
jgi:hypothetical protein|tara:strand:+ start:457 stop:657 length:201 start_codon:yes stop_codon:yes gene_type:complete